MFVISWCVFLFAFCSLGSYRCARVSVVSRCILLPNIKVNMQRVCVALIALTCVLSAEDEAEFKSLMDPLHLFKVYFEELSHGGKD